VTPPVQVISLERTPTRRKVFAGLNGHLNYAFFNAVDGRNVPPGVIGNPRLFEPGLGYTAGAVGCALSHLMLWEQAIRHNTILTVAEDDAIFRLDFEQESEAVLKRVAPDWDVLMWGWNFDSVLSLNAMPGVSPAVMLVSQEQLRASVGRFQAMRATTWPLRLHRCFGTCAYTISPAGAAKFRAECFPLRNFSLAFPAPKREIVNNGIDIAMNRIYELTNSYVAFPPLVATRNENDVSTTLPGTSA
jgi:glycosyl transferase, family 25